MSRQIQIRRGTSAEHDNFTGAIGEITMDTTNNTLRVHDGSTVGGHTLAKKSTTLSGYGITDGANTNLSNLTTTGKNVVANLSMPDIRYSNLTLGATGATYTAPADGYFSLASTFNTNGYLFMYRVTGARYGTTLPYNTNQWVDSFVPVAKGDSIIIQYSGTASVQGFRFIYANGAQ